MKIWHTLNSQIIPSIVDINGPGQVGTAFGQSFIDKRGVRSSTANAYLDPNPFPLKLDILTRALVTKVLFKDKTAVGVVYLRDDKEFKLMAKKEVIVCAGQSF